MSASPNRPGRGPLGRTSALVALVLVYAVLGSCTNEKIVYRDRPPFNTPVDLESGFLGYYDVNAKQTTCGNCHADHQADWQVTKHARATLSLASATGVTAACYACHTTNGNGNLAVGTTVAYEATSHSTYGDVQCESCHGAGLEHVESVGQGNITTRPLAHLAVNTKGSCKDCHSGSHQPFAEEWAQSGHANVSASRASNASCNRCHDGRRALANWGVTSNFAERDTATAYQPTTCAVCHNPHGSPNPAQLRYSLTSTDPAENLCMRCHLNRAEPTPTSSTSPHAPQGGMLIGDAGWRPPGFAYDSSRIFGTHATDRNPKLCAGCHVSRYQVNDAVTGSFLIQATGHLMRPIPCLDEAGIPTGNKNCAYNVTARRFKSCSSAGCHASDTVAANLFGTVRARMKFLADQLWIDSNASSSMQAAPTDAGLLPTVRASNAGEWNSSDGIITPAEGAEFNARLCGEYNQSNADNSKGVHNPFLCELLLIATIEYVQTYYGLPPLRAEVRAAIEAPQPYSQGLRVSRTPIVH